MSFSFLFYYIVNKVTERSRSDSFFSRQYQFPPIVEPCVSPKPRSLSVAEVTEQRATSNEQRATNIQSTNLKNPEQLVPLSWFNRVIARIESDRFKIGR